MLALEGAAGASPATPVCPGCVRTPLVEDQIAAQAATHGISSEDVVDDVLLARTPLKRLVEPEEVADLVAYLCGPGTSSVTGSFVPRRRLDRRVTVPTSPATTSRKGPPCPPRPAQPREYRPRRAPRWPRSSSRP